MKEICPITGLPCNEKKCIHVTDVKNFNVEKEFNLCNKCGVEYMNNPLIVSFIEKIFNFLGEIFKSKVKSEPLVPTCPYCGHTLNDFLKNSRMGCGHCYDYFREQIMPLIESLHKKTVHIGKTPKNIKRFSKEQLQKELQRAIDSEDYKRAKEVKDELDRFN